MSALPRVRSRATPILVVPSAVDSSKFTARPPIVWPTEKIRFVYLGSVGNRYRLDLAGRFLAAAARRYPGVSLAVLSPADPELIRDQLGKDAPIDYSLKIGRT